MTELSDALSSVLSSVDDWPVDTACAAVRDADGEWVVHGDLSRVYGLASVTKLLSAHAMLVAVEEGIVDLDDELSPPGATVRHLLSHAGGVGFASPKPEKEPGERRIYSWAGFDIIADHIHDESGMQFSNYLREATFEPLGMDSSALHGSSGHGGEGSVGDLMRFADEIIEPRVLHPQTVAEALTVQFPGLDGVVPGYGPHAPYRRRLSQRLGDQKKQGAVRASQGGEKLARPAEGGLQGAWRLAVGVEDHQVEPAQAEQVAQDSPCLAQAVRPDQDEPL